MTLPAANAITNAANNGVLQTLLEDQRNIIAQLSGGVAATTITIATGVATPINGTHLIDTEASAATDDLDTLTAGTLEVGQVLVIGAANTARDVVVKHATGNIQLVDSVDLTLTDTTERLVLVYDGTNWIEVCRSASGNIRKLIHIQDQQATTVDGGTFTSGAWQTRVLNTVVTDETGTASLATNQITLTAGTYYLEARCQSRLVNENQLRLQNITDTATTLVGMSSRSNGSSSAYIDGKFTITATKTFELQHRCLTTRATDGFGSANSFGLTEIYSDVKIWRTA